MKSYKNLSLIYDNYMADYDYKSVIDKIEKYLRELKVKNVLDLACGTGNASFELYERAYAVTGVDLSEEMLMVAKEKALEKNYKIKFMLSDMRDFQMNTRFDAVISLTDGFNYLLDEEDLSQAFNNVFEHLKSNGIFIFDMSSIYKFKEIIGNTTFAENDEDSSYIWENYYDEENNILDFDVTIFTKTSKDLFERKMENHTQKGYGIEVIEKLLKLSNFEILDVYGSNESLELSDRLFYVARKPY
ncbi:MAG: class I SAM-dependent methyltransferase [Clostridiales bacterium]|nr:class I SAM-dependent methyltransferase [Clostridiales bacterium]